MPYHFRADPNLFEIEFYGTLTSSDLRALAAELASAESGCEIVPDRVTLLENVTAIELRADELREIAALRKATRFPNRFRSAIVASRAADIGYARQFQALNNHPQIKIGLFPAAEAAREWLLSHRGLAG